MMQVCWFIGSHRTLSQILLAMPFVLVSLSTVGCAASRAERAAEIAISSRQNHQWRRSLAASEVLISEEPLNPLGYALAGDACVELKRYEQAGHYYEGQLRALSKYPDPVAAVPETLAAEFKLSRVRENRTWTGAELHQHVGSETPSRVMAVEKAILEAEAARAVEADETD